MQQLKIAIVGAGGVGGYIGAKLIHNFYDVTLIARGKQYEAVKKNGLKVIDYKDQFTVHPDIVQSVEDEIFDIIFIAVKDYDLQSACRSIENCIDEKTLIIPLLNGVEHKHTVAEYLDKGIFCDGTIYLISNIKEYGVIHRSSYTFYLLYGSDQKDERLLVLREILNQCGLRTHYSNYIDFECWKKYIYVCATSTLTSYFKEPVGYILKEQTELFIEVLIEIKRVADEKGAGLQNKEIEKCMKQADHSPYDTKTAMQIDFEKGSKTELESLCGYIVKEACKLNIEVPHMTGIYEELKQR